MGTMDISASHMDRRGDDLIRSQFIEQEAYARNICHRIHGTYLMEMDLVHRHSVGMGLGLGDQGINCLHVFLHRGRNIQTVNDGGDACHGGVMMVMVGVIMSVVAVDVVTVVMGMAHILQGIPVYSTQVQGELCTPTGAALLKHFVKEFREMPVMTTSKIGYGMGKKDFERANCVRAFLGDTAETGDEIAELSCNLDDMTAEAVGFAEEALFEAGALEVYTVPVGMKKSRPGVLLTCMCRREDEEKMVELLFRHTTTLGVREHISRRFTLKRREETVETAYGPVRKKISQGHGVARTKLEYEDLAAIAKKTGRPLEEIRKEIEK